MLSVIGVLVTQTLVIIICAVSKRLAPTRGMNTDVNTCNILSSLWKGYVTFGRQPFGRRMLVGGSGLNEKNHHLSEMGPGFTVG